MRISRVDSEDTIALATNKIKNISEIVSATKEGCILTKGVFDLIHYGHLSLFAYLERLKRSNGYFIVVAITSDQMVKVKKGSNRPINPEEERLKQIALLPQVDYSSLVSILKPKIYVKGMDTVGKDTDMEKLISKNKEFELMPEDSQIIVFSDNSSISSSLIIDRINISNNS